QLYEDVDGVVLEAAAVGEAGAVASDHAEAVGRPGGRDAHVDLQRVGRHGVGLVDLVEARHPGQERLDEVGAVRLGRVELDRQLDGQAELVVEQLGGQGVDLARELGRQQE